MDLLQAPAGGPRALFGIDIHEMQPYRPLPVQIAEQIAGPDDHRRARLLVPARHRGDQLPRRARQDLGRRRGDRPRARGLRYFHGAGLFELAATTTAACSGSGDAGRGPCRRTPSWSASTPARGRRARSCATWPVTPAPPSRAPSCAPTRSSASARQLTDELPALLERQPRRLSRLRVRHRADGRRGVRGRRRARRAGCSGTAPRRRAGGDGGDRRRLQGAVVPPGPPATVRSWAVAGRELAAAWDRAMAGLDGERRLIASDGWCSGAELSAG